jgi:hypothetical protein
MSMLPGIGVMPAIQGGGGGGGGTGTGSGSECSGSAIATYYDGVYHTIATLPTVRNPTIIEARALGRRTDAAGHGVYIRRAVVYRGVGGAATLLNVFDSPLTRESVSGWDMRIAVSGSSVLIQVRGSAGATVNWRSSWVFSSISGYGLITTDGVYHTIQTVPIPDRTVCLLEVPVVGIRADADGCSGYIHRAVVYRTAGGNATLITVPDSNLTRETVAAWDSTIDVSGDSALIQVRGAAGQTVSWKSDYAFTELTI